MMNDNNNVEVNDEFKTNESIKTKIIILVVAFICLFIIIVVGIKLNNKQTSIETQSKSSLNSIEIRGYELDKTFSTNVFEYNVNVEEDKIQIVCQTNIEIPGCNETIDLKDKNTYSHKIILEEDGKEKVYKININKIVEKEENLRISSIEGNPLEWTNNDIMIKVNTDATKGVESYSFDGGKTWQKSNELKVTSNQILDLIVKDKDGNTTEPKQIKIDKIDKDKPSLEMILQNKTEDKISVKVISNDNLSGVNEIIFNNSTYKDKDLFVVTSPGVYYAEAKDKAGNTSGRVSIEIKSTDFVKESKESKTFTASFVSNGSSLSSSSLSCTTKEDSCKIKTPQIHRDGYEVIGWSTDKNATSATYKVNEEISLTKDQTYYAITKKTLTLKFEKNGADSISASNRTCILYNAQTSCNVKTPTITRNSYDIVGWSTDKNATSAISKENATLALTKDQTYYAITKKTLTLKLEKNGADSISASNRTCNLYNTQTSCNVITPSITRTGGTVIGWSTNKNATTVTYKVNSSIALTSNVTYYAITKKTLTLKLEKNGADSISHSEKTCSIYNTQTSCNVTLPTITRTGGSVIGWSTNKSATTATYKVNSSIALTSNVTHYAITKKTLTLKLEKNGADSISHSEKTCSIYNTQTSCNITLPTITRSGWSILGWGTNKNATTATSKAGENVSISSNITYYAITKKVNTAIFSNQGLDYLEKSSLSCVIYNQTKSCNITLPKFNKKGYFNSFWSDNKAVSSNLFGTTWSWNYFKPVGHTYTLTNNVTLYPNFNHFHYDLTTWNHYKYRAFNIASSTYVGNALFEFESGIPQSSINTFINSMKNAYSVIPWLFNNGKAFVMTTNTYNNYSTAYGLCHNMQDNLGGTAYFTVDLQYDTSISAIDVNAALHEMAHAWDSYYNFRTGNGNICDQSDFNTFYNSISSKLSIDGNGNKISKIETFAGMVTNYYWHILGKNTSAPYYALKNGATLNATEKQNLKTFMEKYIRISNNNYQ